MFSAFVSTDIDFSSNDKCISLRWSVSDPESGIDYCEWAIGKIRKNFLNKFEKSNRNLTNSVTWYCSRLQRSWVRIPPSNMQVDFFFTGLGKVLGKIYSANTHLCLWVKPKMMILCPRCKLTSISPLMFILNILVYVHIKQPMVSL